MMVRKEHRRFSTWYLLAVLAGLVLLQTWLVDERAEPLAYSEFKALLHANRLEALTVGETEISGTVLTAGVARYVGEETARRLRVGDSDRRTFRTERIDDPKLVEELEASGVHFGARRESRWLGPVLWMGLWIAVFLVIWLVVIRRMSPGSGMMSVGKSKAKIYVESDTKVTFDDVAGVDEAKEELREVVNFLREPGRYGRLGAHVPKGVLLVGPPGTGKTLFARAVAGEAKVPFFSISGSEFVEMFVGVGAARVRDLFEQARQRAPAIVFIDELDALGRARGIYPGGGGGHDEKEQTLNQLLVEMDGFDPSQGLVLLAATNRPEILDPALLRAGRFDRQVLVDRPDKAGRIAILRVHVRNVMLADDVELEAVAALTPGFTGADLANLVNEAALLATRRDAEAVALTDFTNAIERIVAGLEKKNRLLNVHEREVVAYHEMGHALVAMLLPGVDPVHKISIIPRGIGALGYTIQRPIEDRFLMTMQELENKMTVLMGGRAAEHLVFRHFSTGASDDLAKATDIARSMVMRYGMDEHIGHAVYEDQRRAFLDAVPNGVRVEMSDETAKIIDRSVRSLLQKSFDRAMLLLNGNRGVLERGARTLLANEVMGEADLKALECDLRAPDGSMQSPESGATPAPGDTAAEQEPANRTRQSSG
jgi:cell division protease FtsH